MLVMDVNWKVMLHQMSEVMSNRTIFVVEHSTHWEFYIDHSENIVLRSRKDRQGTEQDLIFRATIQKSRIIRVQAITWGKHVAITSLLQETREVAGHAVDDIAPDERVPKGAHKKPKKKQEPEDEEEEPDEEEPEEPEE